MEGNGTKENPYEISSIEDLVAFSNDVNDGNNFNGKYVKLINSLDFLADSSYVNARTMEYGDINLDGKVEGIKTELTTGSGFKPIGNYNSSPLPFSGIFDGNKQYIENLYINIQQTQGETDAGLFRIRNRNNTRFICIEL